MMTSLSNENVSVAYVIKSVSHYFLTKKDFESFVMIEIEYVNVDVSWLLLNIHTTKEPCTRVLKAEN